jgi:hypothetical protein
LKYTDPDGEWVHLVIGAAIGGFTNWAMNGAEFSWKGLGYFGVGAAAGTLGAGVGAGISSAIAGTGFGAGFVGASGVGASTGFLAGGAMGAGSGFAGGFTTGAGNSWIQGNGFGQGILQGATYGGIGAAGGFVVGGISGGIAATKKDLNFFTGKGTFDLSSGYAASGTTLDLDVSEVTGKYVGKIGGADVYESNHLGSYKSGSYSGVTIPERGIIVGKGVFANDMQFIKHEFGHILQYRLVGSKAYYGIIAKESLGSATLQNITNGRWDHNTFWTETWANYLFQGYFNSMPWDYVNYPTKNISTYNLLRLIFYMGAL